MSNKVGDIYGRVKDGKSCVKIESEIVDINGIEINSDGSSLVPMSNGMVVQVQHKDYKKTVTKSGTGWSAIDNNLETGFVVAIKPSSSASHVLVSCNLQIGMHASQDARYWGARLYRKIGNGDWTRVTEAENNESVVEGKTTTSVWLSDGMGMGASGHADDYQISNLGNSFLDSPNTTETVYYTIYWKCKLGQSDGDANVVLRLNRAHSVFDFYSAIPISNITAKEIWNSGKIYTPPTTLITTDEINNVVNVTTNLTVANNKVITVPTTDSDGNALTANTTYEMTTGPAGSINNISFVKKQYVYAYWSQGNSLQSARGGNNSNRRLNGPYTIQTYTDLNGVSVQQISNIGTTRVEQNNTRNDGGQINALVIQVEGLYQIYCQFAFVDSREVRRVRVNTEIYRFDENGNLINGHSTHIAQGSIADTDSNAHDQVIISVVYHLYVGDVITHNIERSNTPTNVGLEFAYGHVFKIC